jgi:hypothetical protein
MLWRKVKPMQLFVWNGSGTTLPNNINWTYCAHIRQATFLAERTNVLSILFALSIRLFIPGE